MSEEPPTLDGYYWATFRDSGIREIVQVVTRRIARLKEPRRYARSYALSLWQRLDSYTNWNGPITEERP